jgi:hypothetical protein
MCRQALDEKGFLPPYTVNTDKKNVFYINNKDFEILFLSKTAYLKNMKSFVELT